MSEQSLSQAQEQPQSTRTYLVYEVGHDDVLIYPQRVDAYHADAAIRKVSQERESVSDGIEFVAIPEHNVTRRKVGVRQVREVTLS